LWGARVRPRSLQAAGGLLLPAGREEPLLVAPASRWQAGAAGLPPGPEELAGLLPAGGQAGGCPCRIGGCWAGHVGGQPGAAPTPRMLRVLLLLWAQVPQSSVGAIHGGQPVRAGVRHRLAGWLPGQNGDARAGRAGAGGGGGGAQSRLFGGMSGRCIACAAAWRLQCKHARGGGRRWLTGAAPLAAALRCWRWRASGRGRHDERPPAPAAASPRAAAACLLHRLCPAAGLHHPFWRLPGPGG
jgi:hypothetical protein